jgi:hypothetical protein
MLRITKPGDTKSDFYAWLGMLGPPTIWIVNFEMIYAGVLSACEAKSKVALFISCLICLALIAGCGFLALRQLGAMDGHKARRFMAQVGVLSAALFALVTIAQLIAIIIMDPCSA